MKFTEDIDYDPVHFLRCHSRNNDAADIQTQVWNCAFEPSLKNPAEDTNIVATCGGNSVCFIDCVSGSVTNKYTSSNNGESFYALGWTAVWVRDSIENVTAVGGNHSKIHVICRNLNECLIVQKVSSRSSVSVSGLLFHPKLRSILFCSTSDGSITIFKVNFKKQNEFELIKLNLLEGNSEIFDLSFSITSNVLLASCNDGLKFFKFDSSNSKNENFSSKIEGHFLQLPCHLNNAVSEKSQLVDSVEIIKDSTIACKVALSGKIYIFDFDDVEEYRKNCFRVSAVRALDWSDTDNYFMYMGITKDGNLLCCGDDRGALWVYSLKHDDSNNEPIAIYPWPLLKDSHHDRKRKLNLDVYDIVVDKVAIHSSSKYLVAVTNNNMVCIWKRL